MKLFRIVRKKTGIQSLILVLVWTIVGMYLVFEINDYSANKSMWKYIEPLGNDWYYYRATNSQDPSSNLLKSIEEKYHSLPMSEVFGTPSEKDAADMEYIKCYQYSDKTMEAFSYPLKEGKGFSNQNPNEVLVSPGAAENHPLGSTFPLHLKTQSGVIGTEVEMVVCKVVGVIGQDEIIFPEASNGHPFIFREDLYLFDDCKSERTEMSEKNSFILINPALNISEKCKNPSSGLFFSCSKAELEQVKKDSNLGGRIFSCKDIINNNGVPTFFHIFRWGIRIMLWITVIIALVMWIRGVNKRCKEEIAFFTFIGYPIGKISKRCILFVLPLLLLSYICSFLGYFIPSDIGNASAFWYFSKQAPLILLGVQLVLFLIGGGIGYLLTCKSVFVSGRKVPYIEDLPLPDHIALYFMARGYSLESAMKQASQLLMSANITENNYVPMYRCDFEGKEWYVKFMEGEIE